MTRADLKTLTLKMDDTDLNGGDSGSPGKSLIDFLSGAANTAGQVANAFNKPKPAAASAGPKAAQPTWLMPALIGVGLLFVFGLVLAFARR